MKNTVLALLLSGATLLAAASAPADTPAAGAAADTRTAMCAQGTCQRDVHVVLRQEDGKLFDRRFEVMPPTVQPAFIIVIAGQTVYLEADLVEGRLANIVAVDKVRDPARTITASLRQEEGAGMILEVHNPFAQALRFNMGIMALGTDKLLKTSSCAILAGTSSFEMWPNPLFQVVLGKGRVPQAGTEMECV